MSNQSHALPAAAAQVPPPAPYIAPTLTDTSKFASDASSKGTALPNLSYRNYDEFFPKLVNLLRTARVAHYLKPVSEWPPSIVV